jgi:casein kinase II subunit beta
VSQNWFTSLPGHDYFCEVHEDFIDDDFNLTGKLFRTFASRMARITSDKSKKLTSIGLQSMVPFWKEALDMVLDVEPGKLSLRPAYSLPPAVPALSDLQGNTPS